MGSTSYITTKNGSISQHVEYIAFGEVLFEEHSSSFSSPYLFNGKELDRETNLSYYGARYLDMKTSLWLSLDPLATYNPIFEEEFYFDGDHNDGIYNAKNLNGYGYCYQSPISLIDPNGKQCYFMTPPTERLSGDQVSTTVDFMPGVGDAKGFLEGIIGYDAAGNELSTFDRALGMVFLSEIRGAKKIIKTIDKVSDAAKLESKIAKGLIKAGEKFSATAYRHNLQVFTKMLGNGQDAHHVFPKAQKFAEFFARSGIDVHNPANMKWIESSLHRGKNSAEHLKEWDKVMQKQGIRF